MSVLFTTARPTDWNFPLFLHVLGAMILVGGTLTAASAFVTARGNARSLRLGYYSLLAVALPAYVLMRIGAQWTASREGFDEEGAPEPDWLGVGYIVADLGAILLLVALILGGLGVRRLRNDGGSGLLKATTAISLALLAAYIVAIWAMAGKPG